MFVDEIINEVAGVLVLERLLIYACLLEELLEVGVDVLQVEAMIWVPAYVTDVLEVELGFSPFEFVLRSKTVEFQRARQPPGAAPWCLDLEVVRQLLGQGSVSSSCNFVNGMLLHHLIKNIIIIVGGSWKNIRFITFASCN